MCEVALTWARLRPADHCPNNCKHDSLNKKQQQLRNAPRKLRCQKTSQYRRFGAKHVDFEPQFIARQVTGQSFWDKKIRE